ncbi:MAG: hypothetical protein KGQ41_09755 [Alphaproteobacteria bacterium]|nr:hypothetical protein [Alphaproteobacteria bacterium]
MLKLLFSFFVLVIVVFVFMLLLGVGVFATILSSIFGKRQSPQEAQALRNLSALSQAEMAVLAASLQRGEQSIVDLADSQSIDSLVAKGIIAQSEGEFGVIYYRITDTAWVYLRNNR